MKPRPEIRVEPRFAAVALVDGDNGLGPVVGTRAMEAAIDLARVSGIGLAGVRHSNHFGARHYFGTGVVDRHFRLIAGDLSRRAVQSFSASFTSEAIFVLGRLSIPRSPGRSSYRRSRGSPDLRDPRR